MIPAAFAPLLFYTVPKIRRRRKGERFSHFLRLRPPRSGLYSFAAALFRLWLGVRHSHRSSDTGTRQLNGALSGAFELKKIHRRQSFKVTSYLLRGNS